MACSKRIKFCDNQILADFLVLGTGASGGPFINQLSEGGKYSVFALEAGDYDETDSLIREARFNRVLLSDYWPEYGWQGMSKNEPAAANRNFLWPQTGRIVGGSTAINNMNAVKASVTNVAQWSQLLGPFWSVDNIYRAYKEIETFVGKSTEPASRGDNGPILLTQTPQSGPLPMGLKVTQAMQDATGIPSVIDYNAPSTPIGQTPTWQVFEYPSGIRSDSVTAFLNSNVVTQTKGVMWGVHNRSVVIDLRSTLQKLIIKDRTVVGAIFVREGKSFEVFARRGVILSTGLLSAQYLMLSGIGPTEVLSNAGITPVVVNENVGKQLTNHTAVGVNFTKNPADVLTDPNNPNFTANAGGFLPDPSGVVNPNMRAAQFVYQDGLIPNSNGQPNPAVMALTLFQLQPFSQGQITIDSKDPLKTAIVDYNYLTDPRDYEFYKQAMRKYVRPFALAINAIDPAVVLTSPTLATIDSDPLLEAFLRSNVRQTHHGRGSCLMAPEEAGGVVDTYGHVYGVRNLLNWDTSTLPFQPDGDNCFTVWMGAWVLSRWLREKGAVHQKIEFKLKSKGQTLTKDCNPF